MTLPLQDGECGVVESLEDRLRHLVKVPLAARTLSLSGELLLKPTPCTAVLNPAQLAFWNATEPLVLFAGGVGSGKTHVGSLWARENLCRCPNVVGLIGANTQLQLHKSTLPHLFKILKTLGPAYVFSKKPPEEWGWSSPFERHEGVLSCRNGAQVLCYSLENYDVMRGLQVGWAWLDETRDSRREAFEVVLERLRGFDRELKGRPYRVRITTTPNGFDWLYDFFSAPQTRAAGTRIVTACTRQNPFVRESYYAELRQRMSEKMARQQLLGEFVSTAQGRAYAFDRTLHVQEEVKPQYDLPLSLSVDFNVSPLCAVLLQVNKALGRAWVLEEIHLEDNGLTRQVVELMIRHYFPDFRFPRLLLFGDRTGEHRDTRSDESDFTILQKGLRVFPFTDMHHNQPSLSVVARVEAVNALLRPATGAPRLTIDARCRWLIRDLEQVCFEPGTVRLNDADKTLTHTSDALSYAISAALPINPHRISGYGGGGSDALVAERRWLSVGRHFES